MKILRNILLTVMLLTASAGRATDYTDLLIIGETTESVALTSFNSITFADGKMNLFMSSTLVKSFQLKDLKKMLFTEATGIETTEQPSATIGESSAVYNLQGVRVNCRQSGQLPKGIYIMKQGDSVRKIFMK